MTGDIFPDFPIFKGLSEEQLVLLRPIFTPFDCHAGTVIFEQGELATYAYLIISGEVSIQFKPEDGQVIPIARLHEGSVVGWSAVIGRRFYTSAAICTQYSQFLRLRGADLQALCEHHPETGVLFLERLADVVAERLNCTHPQVMALLENGMRASIIQAGD
jgi:CRP-like cAMP-binding protein